MNINMRINIRLSIRIGKEVQVPVFEIQHTYAVLEKFFVL